ncbi:MAG: hypothetical protein WDZ28_05520 [Simkaniaceae bacterium]
MKYKLLLLIIPLLFFSLPRKKGFTLKKISGQHFFDKRYQAPLPPNEIFNQPYYYLGSGKECYAFASKDNQYVIKFFKQKHISLKPWHQFFPFLFHEKIKKRIRLREKTFDSYMIAYKELKKESGVLYLHLNTEQGFNQTLTLFDHKNQKHKVNLAKMEFLVQEKAVPFLWALQESLEKGKREQSQKLILALILHIKNRREKQISDNDLNCKRNLGVIQERIINIDIGEYECKPSEISFKEEVAAAVSDLKELLKKHELDTFFDEAVNSLL